MTETISRGDFQQQHILKWIVHGTKRGNNDIVKVRKDIFYVITRKGDCRLYSLFLCRGWKFAFEILKQGANKLVVKYRS